MRIAARWTAAAVALAACGAVTATTPARAEATRPAGTLSGTWDLTWSTRKGEVQRGYLVIRQTGARLVAEVHGQGQLRAAGTSDGDAFTLKGRKLGTPFTIDGRLHDARLLGSVKVLSVNRRFVGVRRAE